MKIEYNHLWPVNCAAYYFGGKAVLALLGISVGWGAYTLAMLVLSATLIVGSIKLTRS